MENIVYVLGAGFSAPLGLPVMSNFIVKSKDMYYNNLNKYSNFKSVFESLERMSVIKNYYTSDLFNIEEVLSILEMENSLDGDSNFEQFKEFLAEVIKYYTPTINAKSEIMPGNWEDWVHIWYDSNDNGLYAKYANFIVNLLNLEFKKLEKEAEFLRNGNKYTFSRAEHRFNYSIITLNYDMVIENYLDFLNESCANRDKIHFSSAFDLSKEYNDPSTVYLSKIHGSVEPVTIIPPTWNKSIGDKLTNDWRLAMRLLQDANEIRIIGYSLPLSDSYLKYLFKSSILKSKHLKKIDVICRDHNDVVKNRYDDFIGFNYYRFKNGNVIDYLDKLSVGYDKLRNGLKRWETLEYAHSIFMENK